MHVSYSQNGSRVEKAIKIVVSQFGGIDRHTFDVVESLACNDGACLANHIACDKCPEQAKLNELKRRIEDEGGFYRPIP